MNFLSIRVIIFSLLFIRKRFVKLSQNFKGLLRILNFIRFISNAFFKADFLYLVFAFQETLRAVKKSSVDERQSVVVPETKQTAEKPRGEGKEKSVPSGASEAFHQTALSSSSTDSNSRLSSTSGRGLSSDGSAPVKTKKSDSSSKSRLGNKASNLFSQLHKRISPNK